MKQTYEERVQALAEKRAISHYLKHPEEVADYYHTSFSELPRHIREELIEAKKEDARIAVVEMWLNAQLAYHNAYMDAQEGKDCDFEKFAKEQGLIPDDGQSIRANEYCKSASEEYKAFIRGAACVIATIHRSHGEETSTREAFSACIGSWGALISCNPDPFDLEALQMFNPNKELR